MLTITYSTAAATDYHAAVATRNYFAAVVMVDEFSGDAARVIVSQYNRADGTTRNYAAGDTVSVIVFA
jgi:hypothetical protein